MKIISNVATLLAFTTATTLVPSAFGKLRGAKSAQKSNNNKNRRQLMSSKGAVTHSKELHFAGYTPGLSQCMDKTSLCAGFDAVASSVINSEANEHHHHRAVAYATAGFLCGVAHESFAESFSFFEGSMEVNVEANEKGDVIDKIKSIEIISNFDASAVSFAFSGAASFSGSLAASHTNSHGIVYSDLAGLCDIVESGDLQAMEDAGLTTMEEIEMAQDLVCSDSSPLPNRTSTESGAYASSASVAVAGSMSSSIASSLASSSSYSYFKVEGKDIEQLDAHMIAGVSSFSATDSHSFSGSVAASWVESMNYIESNKTMCLTYVEEACDSAGLAVNGVHGHVYDEAYAGHIGFNDGIEGYGHGEIGLDHAHCEEFTHEEICDSIIAFAGAYAGSFSAAFSAAAAESVAKMELTAGFSVHVSNENDEFIAEGGHYLSHPVSFYPSCDHHYY